MPGRGESAYFDNAEDYNFAQYLADIDRFLEQIGCMAPASCDWLGVSMGGLLGFYVAARKSSPIRNLILVDVGIEVPQEDLNFIAQYITVTNVYNQPEDLVPLLKMALGGPYSRGPMDEDQWLHFAKTYLRQTADGKYSRNMDDKIAVMFQKEPLGSINLENLWADIKQPTLALRGKLSTLFPMRIAEKMLQTKPVKKWTSQSFPTADMFRPCFAPIRSI